MKCLCTPGDLSLKAVKTFSCTKFSRWKKKPFCRLGEKSLIISTQLVNIQTRKMVVKKWGKEREWRYQCRNCWNVETASHRSSVKSHKFTHTQNICERSRASAKNELNDYQKAWKNPQAAAKMGKFITNPARARKNLVFIISNNREELYTWRGKKLHRVEN